MFRVVVLLAAFGAATLVSGADVAKYRQDGYFGKETLKDGQSIPADNTAVRRFNISMPESELTYLKERLANARFIEHIPETAFNYGFNSDEMKQLVSYWNSTYDWRKEEAALNAYPQYLTQIEGIDVHFVHVPASPKAKTVIPLVTVHGWPSTFYEIYPSLPLLTEPDQDGVAYEVIAPSIPGFGWGEAAHQKGMENTAMARIYTKLMLRLGHEQYFLQGGDWGSIITRAMAIMYPEHVIGIHVIGLFDALENLLDAKRFARNLFTPHLPSLDPAQWKKDYNKLFPLKEKLGQAFEETGILHLMATKPDTICGALVDSPVGMAAHVLEKYSSFVNMANRDLKDGGLKQKWTKDELLTIVMIFWNARENFAGTCRMYKELVSAGTGVTNEKIMVPAGVVDAPHEVIQSPRIVVEGNYAQLLQYTDLPEGGHFMIFEVPELVEQDLRKLTQKILAKDNSGLLSKIRNRVRGLF